MLVGIASSKMFKTLLICKILTNSDNDLRDVEQFLPSIVLRTLVIAIFTKLIVKGITWTVKMM